MSLDAIRMVPLLYLLMAEPNSDGGTGLKHQVTRSGMEETVV